MTSEKVSRRKILATVGSTSIVYGTPIVHAKEEGSDQFRDAIEQANNLRKRVERASQKGQGQSSNEKSSMEKGREAWENHLENSGYKLTSNRHIHEYDEAPDNEIGPEKIDDVKNGGVDSTLTLVQSSTNYYIEHSFQLLCRWSFNDPSKTDPKDSIGIRWNNDCWKFAYDDMGLTSSSSDHVEYHENAWQGQSGSTGAFGAEIDDKEIFYEWVDNEHPNVGDEEYSYTEYFGVFLEDRDTSGCHSDADTEIEAVYSHAFEDQYDNFGVSAGPGGAAISYNPETFTDYVDTNTEEDGSSPLAIRKSESEWGGT